MNLSIAGRHARACRSPRAVLGLLAALAFGACSGATSPTGMIEWEALRNHARWRSQKLHSYAYTYSRYCFCGEEMVGVRVEVREGLIVSAIRPDGSADQHLDRYPTVNQLFDFIDAAARSKPDYMKVTYDAARGYPTSIAVDYRFGWADDEMGHQASGLTPLDGLQLLGPASAERRTDSP